MTATDDLWASETFGLRIDHVDGAEPITGLVLPGLRRNPGARTCSCPQCWGNTLLSRPAR